MPGGQPIYPAYGHQQCLGWGTTRRTSGLGATLGAIQSNLNFNGPTQACPSAQLTDLCSNLKLQLLWYNAYKGFKYFIEVIKV